MFGHSSTDDPADTSVDDAREALATAVDAGTGAAVGKALDKAGDAGTTIDKAGARRATKLAKTRARSAARVAKEQAKTDHQAAQQSRKTSKAESKLRRAEAKASKAASEAAAEAASKAATGPARLVDRLTDPKIAKRVLSVGKVLAPALAPYAIKAAISTRGFLDHRRAHQLGVSVDEVASFRGPTGATGARISGLARSIDELAARKGTELQVTRFAEVSRKRLEDLTTAVQASASMPRAGRAKVLRAVNRELDSIGADLMTHLMGSSAA